VQMKMQAGTFMIAFDCMTGDFSAEHLAVD
jgi:hypothetical protein